MDGIRPPGLEHRAARIPPLRGYGELLRPLSGLLPALLALSLSAGLLLRLLAVQPQPADMMNLLGCVCWLLGFALASPLQHMLLRLERHRLDPVRRLATRAKLLLATFLAACALTLAMLPVHFCFDQTQELFLVQTLNPHPLSFRSAYFLLLLHVLAGPACLLLSTGLLRLLRQRLPAHPAALLWLATGSALVLAPAALHSLWDFPMSLGQLSSWVLEFMFANKQLTSPYIQELINPVLLRIGLIWLLALTCVWLSLLAPARAWQRIRPLWLACCGGLLAAGLRTLALTLRWTHDVLPLTPDGWWTILLTGTYTAWLLWLLCCLTGDSQRLGHSLRRDGVWLLLLPGGLLALTIPCLQTDEASRLTMLGGLLLLLPVLLLGFLLPLQIMRLPAGAQRLLALLPLFWLLLLPMPEQSMAVSMLAYMKEGFILPRPEAEQLRIWLCLLALVLVAWPGLLHGLLSRPRLRPRRATALPR